MPSRRYRVLLLGLALTAIATAATWCSGIGIARSINIAGFNTVSVGLTNGCVWIQALDTTNAGVTLPTMSHAYFEPFRFPRLYPSIATTAPGTPIPGLVYRQLCIPPWMGAAPVLARQFRRATRKVHVPGHCKRCGYNISTITSCQCPECGSEIAIRPRGVESA